MRRGLFVLLLLPPLTTAASAQTQGPAPVQLVAAATMAPATAENVVDRIMSFDRNKDGRVTGEELPERMLNLLANDTNGDGALVASEITARALVQTRDLPSRPPTPMGFATTVPGLTRGGGGGYTFGDQVSLSSRSHVEGALDDLRLDTVTREQALAIVHPFMDTVEARAAATLAKELTPLLTEVQLETFKAALARQMTTTGAKGAPSPGSIPPPFNRSAQFFRMEPDLTFRIHSFQLPPEQAARALVALDRFKATIRPGDAEREALLEKLSDVLGPEERENFGAALARRPLVKASDVMAGLVDTMGQLRQGAGSFRGEIMIVRPTNPPQRVEP
jgi:hypothetical protein